MILPTLDLSRFTRGNDQERQQLAKDLCASLLQHGFVKLVNHGVPDEAVLKLFEWVCIKPIEAFFVTELTAGFYMKQNKSFFQMPTTEKVAIAHQPGPSPQRGWSTVGAENSSKLYKKGFLNYQMTEELKDARVS